MGIDVETDASIEDRVEADILSNIVGPSDRYAIPLRSVSAVLRTTYLPWIP